jgi:hypothetical protein
MIGGKMAVLGVVVLAFISLCVADSLLVSYEQTMPPVELSCTDAVDSVKLQWLLNGTNVATRKDWTKEFTIFETNKTLRLLKVDQTTVGLPYTCQYENGTTITTFNLKAKPYIKPFEKGRNVIQGDPLSLECRAWGIPKPEITWFRNNTVSLVPDGSGKITLKNNSAAAQAGFPVVDNATLRIEQLDNQEHGNYTCFATIVIDGEKYTANATVLVQVKGKYDALWPFLGICVEVAILCAIILIYEKRRAKRIAEEERPEEAERLNAPSDTKTPVSEDVRQRR